MVTNFTDQLPHLVDEADMKLSWGGVRNAERFRCYLCGHKFEPGDEYRWVLTRKYSNFFVCVTRVDGGEVCDAPTEELIPLWEQRNEEARTKYWWFIELAHRCD